MFGKFNYVNHWNIYLNMIVYKSFKYVGIRVKKSNLKKYIWLQLNF